MVPCPKSHPSVPDTGTLPGDKSRNSTQFHVPNPIPLFQVFGHCPGDSSRTPSAHPGPSWGRGQQDVQSIPRTVLNLTPIILGELKPLWCPGCGTGMCWGCEIRAALIPFVLLWWSGPSLPRALKAPLLFLPAELFPVLQQGKV